MKKVTVVGAGGFIGGAIVKGLSECGYNPARITRNSKYDGYDEDVVFYLAGSSTPNYVADIESDFNALKNYLSKLKNRKTRPLFVFASTAGAVYSPFADQPYRESSLLSPSNPYGEGKLAQEELVRQCEWVAPLILRLSNIYGPQQQLKPGFGVIAHWAHKVCSHEKLTMIGNSTRDYLNVFDLVRLALKIMRTPQEVCNGLTVNVGSGDAIDLKKLYEVFLSVVGRPINMNQQPARAFDVEAVAINIALANELFSWYPEISIEEGVKSVLDTIYLSRN